MCVVDGLCVGDVLTMALSEVVVCCIQVFPFRPNATGAGQFCLERGTKMNHQNLKVCMQTLRDLREEKHHHLDASVIKELDAVIEQLEGMASDENGAVKVDQGTVNRALLLIAGALDATTNLIDLIDRFFGTGS